MGVSASAIKIMLELWQRGQLKGLESVMEMGSQELHLTRAQFEQLIAAAAVPGYRREDFPGLDNWPAHPRASARHFYKLLGLEDYHCVDLNKEHGAVALDLNKPLEDRSLWGKFGVVTDHGTNEHIFNVSEAYRTMHRLCRKGGLIFIAQAVYGGNGYYHFDLSFFEGLAAANGYRILYGAYNIPAGGTQFNLPLSRELLSVLDWSKINLVGISYVFEKMTDEDFKLPQQNEFLAQSQGHHGFKLEFLPLPPSRTYVPLTSPQLEAVGGKTLLKLLLGLVKKKLRLG